MAFKKGAAPWNKGLHNVYSKETMRRMREGKKGQVPWNRGRTGPLDPQYGKKQSPEIIKKRVDARRKNNSFKGCPWPRSAETREKIRQARLKNNPGAIKPGERRGKRQFGPEHWNWKGGPGLTADRKLIHKTLEYKTWRQAVFVKDDYTCRLCMVRGGSLVAHHIFKWADYPELRFSVTNGMALCKSCHLKTHTKRGKKD